VERIMKSNAKILLSQFCEILRSHSESRLIVRTRDDFYHASEWKDSRRRPQAVRPGLFSIGIRKSCARMSGLSWYAQYFEMVEVIRTFYSIPDLRMG